MNYAFFSMDKVLCLLCFYMLALIASAKDNPFAQEKAIVRKLKKQYKLERVEIKRPYNNFKYYQLLTKDLRWMIADSMGNVIIPQSKVASDSYQNTIQFVGAHERGFGKFREKAQSSKTVTAYYPGNETVFIAQKGKSDGGHEYEFFSVSGRLLSTFEGSMDDAKSMDVFITKDVSGSYGLMSKDGKELLPNDYLSIEVSSDGICILTQIEDGIERKGGVCLSGMDGTKVPCLFHAVNYSPSEKCWKVQVHEFDSITVYDESRQYNTSFLDEGQKLFERKEYGEARKFYTLRGDTARWAKFYIGATHYVEAKNLYKNIFLSLSKFEESSSEQDRNIASNIRGDFNKFRMESEKAEQAFRVYLKQDTRFSLQTKEMLYELSEKEMATDGLEERLKRAVADFNHRCAEVTRKEQEEHNRQLELQQQNLEQQRLNLERQKLWEQQRQREQRERALRMKKQWEMQRKQEKQKKEEDEKKSDNRLEEVTAKTRFRSASTITKKDLEKKSQQ